MGMIKSGVGLEHGAVTASRNGTEWPPVCQAVAIVSEDFAHLDLGALSCALISALVTVSSGS